MLLSLALVFLVGLLLGGVMKKLRLPALLGMLVAGIILGPYVLDLLDESLLSISSELRQIALVIILLRAGLSLDIADLKKVGRPAILMCFVPACFEICGMLIFAPLLFDLTIAESALLGSVIAAVSPAVIVPKMLMMMEKGYGTQKGIPQLIMAGASVDDVFVIVLFTAFTSLVQGDSVSVWSFAQIPISVLTGAVIGVAVGLALAWLFSKIHVRDSVKVIVILSIAFIFEAVEGMIGKTVPFSGLLAVMSFGIAFQKKRKEAAVRLSAKFSKIWIGAEIMLFVLVGATIDLKYASAAIWQSLLLIGAVLVFRMVGVLCCLIRSKLNAKERLFCAVAYTPKATVQAAIGGVPLAMGLACGNTVLTVAVIAILVTAPLGALAIDLLVRKTDIFKKDKNNSLGSQNGSDNESQVAVPTPEAQADSV